MKMSIKRQKLDRDLIRNFLDKSRAEQSVIRNKCKQPYCLLIPGTWKDFSPFLRKNGKLTFKYNGQKYVVLLSPNPIEIKQLNSVFLNKSIIVPYYNN